ncbi:MAG: hypothetical protein P8H59_11875 [Flavobacteriales bacterium]|nr:hypothetical protein [Flavobacteriales bacterium]MDG1781645.1 hypothetical protein [Flavobacteriales bacterium]MDG2246787.1 hypothetical protein [Flavobacteriales bacterium]
MKGIILVLFVWCLASCSTNTNRFTTEVKQIDSLHQEVLSAQERYAQLDAQRTEMILGIIKEDMSKMTMKFKGQMSEEDAVVFSEYNSAKRLIKDFPKRNTQILRETERTLNQLTQFKEALNTAATEDGMGNEINAEYVSKQYAVESRVASALIEQINSTIGYAEEATSEFERLEGSVRTILGDTLVN